MGAEQVAGAGGGGGEGGGEEAAGAGAAAAAAGAQADDGLVILLHAFRRGGWEGDEPNSGGAARELDRGGGGRNPRGNRGEIETPFPFSLFGERRLRLRGEEGRRRKGERRRGRREEGGVLSRELLGLRGWWVWVRIVVSARLRG